jgi:hypothetical protein
MRHLSQAQKIHQQLGGDGYVDGWITKPKGMHHSTFKKKLDLMNRYHNTSNQMAFKRFGGWC